jgi:hypothetical protein
LAPEAAAAAAWLFWAIAAIGQLIDIDQLAV